MAYILMACKLMACIVLAYKIYAFDKSRMIRSFVFCASDHLSVSLFCASGHVQNLHVKSVGACVRKGPSKPYSRNRHDAKTRPGCNIRGESKLALYEEKI